MNFEYESLQMLKNINNHIIDLINVIRVINKRLIDMNDNLHKISVNTID